jgi:hypothetical protein
VLAAGARSRASAAWRSTAASAGSSSTGTAAAASSGRASRRVASARSRVTVAARPAATVASVSASSSAVRVALAYGGRDASAGRVWCLLTPGWPPYRGRRALGDRPWHPGAPIMRCVVTEGRAGG